MNFPKNFLWGVAYSSHQVEGDNFFSDWWEWEQKGKTREISGKACNNWELFRKDHQLAEELGCGAIRLSLEWAKIEPQEGEFSLANLSHYKEVLVDIRKRKMKRVLTLWHWSLPNWVAKRYGGWHGKKIIFLFERYCERILDFLGKEIDFLIILNEPIVFLNNGYLRGKFPPGKRNLVFYLKAKKNLIEAYKKAYQLVKRKNQIPVGITNLFNFFEPNSFFWRWPCRKISNWFNYSILDRINEFQDFVGINYYFHNRIGFCFKKGFFNCNLMKEKSDLNWEIYPRGIYEVVKDAWQRYQKPIYIFENGLADRKDKYRQKFIYDHLRWLYWAIKEGVLVRGYFHWSLIDNFEWCHGFDPRFGLCEVDYKTFERRPRPSYFYYQSIIKNNRIV